MVNGEKFVVRLLDKDAQLLAWTTVYAAPRTQERGASCPFWPTGPTQFVVEQAGLATEITIHWCDLDVARRNVLVEPVQVEFKQLFTFNWVEPVWVVAGMRDVPLPAVTLHAPVTIDVATGTLMGVGR